MPEVVFRRKDGAIPFPERRYFHTICQRHCSVDDNDDAPHAAVVAQDRLYVTVWSLSIA